MEEVKVYWIDLFCGAGGTSTGIHLASEYTKVLACVNHDANAIKSHLENHPEAIHFTEDYKLIGNQTEQKKFIGNAVEVNQAKALVQCHYNSLKKRHSRLAS